MANAPHKQIKKKTCHLWCGVVFCASVSSARTKAADLRTEGVYALRFLGHMTSCDLFFSLINFESEREREERKERMPVKQRPFIAAITLSDNRN